MNYYEVTVREDILLMSEKLIIQAQSVEQAREQAKEKLGSNYSIVKVTPSHQDASG